MIYQLNNRDQLTVLKMKEHHCVLFFAKGRFNNVLQATGGAAVSVKHEIECDGQHGLNSMISITTN